MWYGSTMCKVCKPVYFTSFLFGHAMTMSTKYTIGQFIQPIETEKEHVITRTIHTITVLQLEFAQYGSNRIECVIVFPKNWMKWPCKIFLSNCVRIQMVQICVDFSRNEWHQKLKSTKHPCAMDCLQFIQWISMLLSRWWCWNYVYTFSQFASHWQQMCGSSFFNIHLFPVCEYEGMRVDYLTEWDWLAVDVVVVLFLLRRKYYFYVRQYEKPKVIS